MNGRRRLTPVLGIAFGPLLVAGFLLQGIGFPTDEPVSGADIVAFYDDHQGPIQLGGTLTVLGALCFLGFLGALRERIAGEAPDRSDGRSLVPIASGVLYVGLVMIGAAFTAAIPGTIEGFEQFTSDPNTAFLVSSLSWLVAVMSASVPAAVFLAGASATANRTGALPTWLVRAGYAFAVLSILLVLVAPVHLLLVGVWGLCAAVIMLRDTRARAALHGPAVATAGGSA